MTPSPDEQTETDLDPILVTFGQILQRYSPESADVIRLAYRAAKRDIEAWSRQQTAQVLDKLEDRLLDNSIALMNEDTAVKWDEVVAAIAALRVGLEGKQIC